METPTQNMPEGGAEPQTVDTAPTEMMEQKQTFLGPLIGILLAVIVLALGWLYLWPTTGTNEADGGTTAEPSDSPAESAPANHAPSSPEDLSDIEADLEAEVSGIDEDLNVIDAAFEE